MIVFPGFHTFYNQIGWTVLDCPYCNSSQVFKVEDILVKATLYSIPIGKHKKGSSVRCDFCNSVFASSPDMTYVPLNSWSPNDGFSRLLDSVAPNSTIKISEDISDDSLHSLLRYVDKSTSLVGLELSTTWLLIGGLVSLLITIPIAWLLYDSGIVKTTIFNRFGFIAICSIFGFVLGALLIGTIRAILKRKRLAFDHLQVTSAKYKLNLDRLDTLSRSYSYHVRKAVSRLCHKEIFSADDQGHGLSEPRE